MSSHRWRFLAQQIDAQTWHITDDEAEHLSRVLRLEIGDAIEVTDGSGNWALGRLRNNRGKTIVVDCEPALHESNPPWQISLAVGALKPGMIDDLLPGLVELGVDQIMIFQQSGVAKARLSDSAVERWQRILINAIKQCKRARLPTLRVFPTLSELLTRAEGCKIVLDPESPHPLYELVAPLATDLVFLAGGERGLDATELQAIKAAGFVGANLGPNILRAVTAATAVTALAALRRAASTC